ncbi:Fic family protein [Flavobacterium arsenatis]|uniref:Fic family protein n=1 Tax=Flavobacterium arsenatis TaxID=1484332 RepID=A0ABU1TS34_9FLAO|nr:Fic family protein [Flavobacterium arsenatis]MDR6968685.1 Fic family protein [Flavobacterium arsenatis]
MEEIIQALDLKKELDNLRPIDKEQEDRIMQKFRLDWNYHSNHLEGNSLTYGETKALILFGVTAQGKALKDHFEITGHNEAIDWVIDMIKGERPLTENFIRELHVLLLKESSEKPAITPDGKPTTKRINVGSYKTSPNHVQTVTGEIFYFATPEETPAKMTDLLNWYKEKIQEKDVNPIFLASEFHYKFIRIHPFDDGNGRTARILMNFILMQFGFPPVIIKTEDKSNYFIALQLADAGNIEAFIKYIAQNLVRSLQIMIAGAKGESVEEPDDLDKEIALLEQRLTSIDETKNSTILLFSKSVFKLFDDLLFNMSKFKKLYRSESFSLSTGDKNVFMDIIGFNKHVKDYINNDKILEDITAEFIYSKLKGFENLDSDFSVSYQIQFYENNSYKVTRNDYDIILEKEKLIRLTDSEIDKIVKSEVKRHKEFIEQKIAERENTK